MFNINERCIISFAAGATYNIVNETDIHAHPIKRGFPRLENVPDYLMVRAKGGKSEKLYKIVLTVEFNPLNDGDLIKYKKNHFYNRLNDYISKRKASRFGFDKAPLPYRFYILEPVYFFNPVFELGNNPQGYRLLSFNDINTRKEDTLL